MLTLAKPEIGTGLRKSAYNTTRTESTQSTEHPDNELSLNTVRVEVISLCEKLSIESMPIDTQPISRRTSQVKTFSNINIRVEIRAELKKGLPFALKSRLAIAEFLGYLGYRHDILPLL